jgi:hypothetical protein
MRMLNEAEIITLRAEALRPSLFSIIVFGEPPTSRRQFG